MKLQLRSPAGGLEPTPSNGANYAFQTSANMNHSISGANSNPQGHPASSSSDSDELSSDILYIAIAASAAIVILLAVLLLLKISRGQFFSCSCRQRPNTNCSNGNPSDEISAKKCGRGKSGSKTKAEDPLKNLIVPDIKIMDEDGNIIPRASFS
ncbi:uncharacterized protein LOC142336883 isoform X2 [Convolutriloba macropyga]